MTARDFCYWLQGFVELTEANPAPQGGLTPNQLAVVQRHLAMVFAHDLDPKAGPPAVQQKLNMTHGPDTVVRC